MFTGIVQEAGIVTRISRRQGMLVLDIEARPVTASTLPLGASVSVNGVCLTVVAHDSGLLRFEAMPQTVKDTNIGLLRRGEKVNLEPALKVGDMVSGHFLTGHVDCMGIIRSRSMRQGNLCFEIALPPDRMRYLVDKGSIAVDGISLTVMSYRSNTFSVYIIPHTLTHTTLGYKGPSDRVNVEFDMLVKGALKLRVA
jgi:riboflavin synthase